MSVGSILGVTVRLPRPSSVFALLLTLLCASVLGIGLVTPAMAGASQGQAIVSAAASQVGVPYCWDGGEPTIGPTHGDGDFDGEAPDCTKTATRGFDCSGLALWAVYQATAGAVDLPHSASLQASEYASYGGELITSESGLEPGDLIFFGDPGGLSNATHVGIYAGGGEMWDANTAWGRYGDGVYERSVNETEHDPEDQFLGGVRYWHGGGSGGATSEGSFVSYQGNVYRIAGGAPVYVSSWNAVGGPQPTTSLTNAQFAALPEYPRDGTILDGSGGKVFVVVGGAPLYVSSWNAIGGEKSGVQVDEAAIDNAGGGVPWNHLLARPINGTLVVSGATGMVYEMVGGAPLYVSEWAAIGGERSSTEIDQWDIDNPGNPAAHLSAVPADGTLVASGATGMVYEIVGGAPLYVSEWAAIGGERSSTEIDQWDLTNISNPAAHLNPVPTNGTLVVSGATGMVYEIAGGAPLYVSEWAAIGGERSSTEIDQWDLTNISNPAAHLNTVPANGTFLNTSTGHVYRVAGGAPFAVSSWSVFGGEQPYVTVDEWDIDNITNPAAHLNETPANGTIVEGLPSDTYWSFSKGLRTELSPTAGATTVDDFGLAAYPEPAPAPVPITVHTEAASTTSPSTTPNAGNQSKATTPSLSPTPSHGVLGTKTSRPASRSSTFSRALATCRKIKSRRKRAKCETTAKRLYNTTKKKKH